MLATDSSSEGSSAGRLARAHDHPQLSIVVPVYRNAESIEELVDAIAGIAAEVGNVEAVFVVDGSPDSSYARLYERLPGASFRSQLVTLTRNFGAFAAIRVGIGKADGDVIAVMAADLQEPPELVVRFRDTLARGEHDVAFGIRESRADPLRTRIAATIFWSVYRRTVMPDVPPGGVDIFALTRAFRDRLLQLNESHSSLLAQLFWLGGRRAFLPYARRQRKHGKSAWTFRKKLRYLSDSVFAFTDLPIRLLVALGSIGLVVAIGLGCVVLLGRVSGWVEVPGYAGTMLAILFFGALNTLGLGVVGTYAWRGYENTKERPLAVVQSHQEFEPE